MRRVLAVLSLVMGLPAVAGPAPAAGTPTRPARTVEPAGSAWSFTDEVEVRTT
ncbi:hypothetical protein [Nonomuraea angiospora]